MHIADPTHSLAVDSEIDHLARKRVSTIYLPGTYLTFSLINAPTNKWNQQYLESKISMMPTWLYKQYSLEPARDNMAMTFAAQLDSNGAISQFQIFPSLISKVSFFLS